jgi:hypothetical protein
MNMNEKLKKKYTCWNEPLKARNNARFKNCTQFSGGKAGNQGKSRTKKMDKGSGFSGRSIGKMLRAMPASGSKKK